MTLSSQKQYFRQVTKSQLNTESDNSVPALTIPMVSRSKELQWRCYSARGNVPSKRLISLVHLSQNVDQISFKIMTKHEFQYLEQNCEQTSKSVLQYISTFSVLRVSKQKEKVSQSSGSWGAEEAALRIVAWTVGIYGRPGGQTHTNNYFCMLLYFCILSFL